MFTEVLLVMAALMLAAVGQWMVYDQTAPFFQAFDVRTKHEWVNRSTAAVVTAIITAFSLFQGYPSLWGESTTIAYFLHDMGHMLLYDSDITTYGHHIVSLTVTGLMKTVMTLDQARTTGMLAGVLESTSPLVNLSWLLKQAGYSDRPWFKYVAGSMAGFFGIMRCVVFPWIVATRMDTASKMLWSPLVAMNFFWFYKILRLVQKALKQA